MHLFDARSKILLLFIFSISIFFITSYFGLIIDFCLLLFCIRKANIVFRNIFSGISVIYIICTLIIVFNSFSFGESLNQNINSLFYPFLINAETLNNLNYLIIGSFSFSFTGLCRGIFYAFRILLLTWATLLVCFTTSTNEMTFAFSSFLRPLKKIGVPIDDVSMVCSIALRFIPLTFEEYSSIKEAQWSRGAHFDSGTYASRIKAHIAIFVPLLINLFKKANKLAIALDSRCYGYCERTNIHNSKISSSTCVLSLILAISIIVVAIAL